MSKAKFKTGESVIIARPEANFQLQGVKTIVFSKRRNCLTADRRWMRGYVIVVGGQPFVAVESELDPA